MRPSDEAAWIYYAKVFDEEGKPSENVEELNKENFRFKEELGQCQEEQKKANTEDEGRFFDERKNDIFQR